MRNQSNFVRYFVFVTAAILIFGPAVADDALNSSDTSDRVLFNRDIRPILSENCYHCHGPDDNARAADLRLDLEDAAKEFAIEEGDAEASELFLRVVSDDADVVMPPLDSERKLTKQQIETLRRWIDQGAEYQGHWSFSPVVRPAVPEVDQKRAVNAIDQFVIKQLQEKNLTLADHADRATLIRRVTFDLTGIPPTLGEIDDFLNDTSPDAYVRLVDRLLASPRFGERMAADWLDVARYSDTYGYQVDRDRFVWPWRDWVVRVLNENMPYDRFITNQLAGDLLPDAKRDNILATAFNRLHPQKVEGGSVPEEFRIEYVADRTQTVATAMMGLTYECCRCHNHKYDPISQSEYFQLSAFFDKIDEAGLYSYFTPSVPTPTLTLPTESQEARMQRLASEIHQLELELVETRKQQRSAAESRVENWLSKSTDDSKSSSGSNTDAGFWADTVAKPIESLDFESDVKAPNEVTPGVIGNAVKLTGDDAINTKVGNFKRFEPFSVSLWMKTPDVKERAVVFHRSRAWTDAASRGYQLLIEDGKLSWSLIHFWPGNAIRVQAVDTLPVDQWVHVTVTNDGSSRASGLRIFVNGEQAETTVVRDSLTKQITGGGGDNIAIGERFRDRGFTGGSVDEFQVYDRELTGIQILRVSRKSGEIPWINQPASSWTQTQLEMVVDHFLRTTDERIAKLQAKLKSLREQYCKVQDELQEIMVMREFNQGLKTYRLDRGAYDNRAEEVQPGTPAALTEYPPSLPKNRLGLAKWLTMPEHPLTSRVAVNRLWQMCFGIGLVRTPEDFGSQGQPPTHPELLDFLASDFVSSGWDTKRMLKQIVLSATYRQSSVHPDQKRVVSVDPENRLLARFPSYRLPAEMLRDNALAISGRLVNQLGGAPVKPYELEASFKPSQRDKGRGLYRRSLYTYWKRTGPAPAMMTLDASKRDVCRVQRERTASPLQAFVLLNGPQYVEAARGLAEQLLLQHGDAIDVILHDGFRTLTSRVPTEEEMTVLKNLYSVQHDYFSKQKEQAAQYVRVGDASPIVSLDNQVLAATTTVFGTLLSYDESVTKR
jgi:hypothetical protein